MVISVVRRTGTLVIDGHFVLKSKALVNCGIPNVFLKGYTKYHNQQGLYYGY